MLRVSPSEESEIAAYVAGRGTWEPEAVKASLDKLHRPDRPNQLDATQTNPLDCLRKMPKKHIRACESLFHQLTTHQTRTSPFSVQRFYTQKFQSVPVRPLNASMASLYDQSIPVFVKYLKNMSRILDMTVAYANEKGLEHNKILSFRLREDMRP